MVRGKAATLEAEVARLQFENEVLEQQALSTVQSGVEYVQYPGSRPTNVTD